VTFTYILGPAPFLLFDQSDALIQLQRDLIGLNNKNGQLKPWLHKHNKMAEDIKHSKSHQTLFNEVGGV